MGAYFRIAWFFCEFFVLWSQILGNMVSWKSVCSDPCTDCTLYLCLDWQGMGYQEGYVHFQGHEEGFEEPRPSFKPLALDWLQSAALTAGGDQRLPAPFFPSMGLRQDLLLVMPVKIKFWIEERRQIGAPAGRRNPVVSRTVNDIWELLPVFGTF